MADRRFRVQRFSRLRFQLPSSPRLRRTRRRAKGFRKQKRAKSIEQGAISSIGGTDKLSLSVKRESTDKETLTVAP